MIKAVVYLGLAVIFGLISWIVIKNLEDKH